MSQSAELLYRIEPSVDPAEVIEVFESSGIKRPTDDFERIRQMLLRSDLTICARDNGRLVGIARSLTDFCYCCYLSDLAVHRDYQKRGIGKELVRKTREAIGPQTMLLLLAADTAEGYYPHIQFEPVTNGWIIKRQK